MHSRAHPHVRIRTCGDSGVGYSKGFEDLFATAFGAKRQSKKINEANVGEFASEVGEAFRTAVSGAEK